MIVHLITDRHRLAPNSKEGDALTCLTRQAQLAVDAGVDVIQIRERDLDARALFLLTQAMVRIARGTATRVLVNDRLDVALAAAADGVHLPAHSLPVAAVRVLAPRGFIIGRSVHTREELRAAVGADYVIAGAVWPTASKPDGHAWLGTAGLASLVRATRIPVLAVGGVSPDRFGETVRAGAVGIAAIGLFVGEPASDGCGAIPIRSIVGHARRCGTTSPGI